MQARNTGGIVAIWPIVIKNGMLPLKKSNVGAFSVNYYTTTRNQST